MSTAEAQHSVGEQRIARRRTSRLALSLRARRHQARATAARPGLGWVLLSMVAVSGVAVLGTALVLLASAATTYLEAGTTLRDAGAIVAGLPRGGARVYDRNGELLYSFANDAGERRPVPLSEVSDYMVAATVAVEDPTFFENRGVDPRGLARAAVENLQTLIDEGTLGGSGGSTITQQLARTLYMDTAERAERTIDRKLREAVIAMELTRRYSKEQILEWYLNSISYGGIYLGVETAAQAYFGKSAADLSLGEAALLAGIPQSPARYNPLVNEGAARARQRVVLEAMVTRGMITAEQAGRAAEKPLQLREPELADVEAGHFLFGPVLEEVVARFGERALYEDGLEIHTTLDLELQREVQGILESQIAAFEEQLDGHNGAVYVIDPTTGEVLVYLGSRDYGREDIDGNVDEIRAVNSPGSALKPFTYIAAFSKGWGTGTGIIDAPLTLTDAATGDPYEVRNPIAQYSGVVTVADALGNSLNVPAVRAIEFAGIEETVELMKRFGFTTLDAPGGYGPALTVGGADVTLEDMVYAYSTLATGGLMRGAPTADPRAAVDRPLSPVVLQEVVDASGEVIFSANEELREQRVVPESYTYMISSILSDPQTQCLTFSRCGALTVPGLDAAVKTGTSEPFTDAVGLRLAGETWAVGYTSELVAGVWYGNSDNSPLHDAHSTQVGWPILRDTLVLAHEHLGRSGGQFKRPATVESLSVCWPSGRLPTSACPANRRYESLFAEESLPQTAAELASAVDTWWQRSGGWYRLTLPSREVAGWSGLRDWYVQHGLASGGALILGPPVRTDGGGGGRGAGNTPGQTPGAATATPSATPSVTSSPTPVPTVQPPVTPTPTSGPPVVTTEEPGAATPPGATATPPPGGPPPAATPQQ